ncbi:MAG: glycosyltransferase family 39 protein [Planctomycetota bacterium]
MATHPGSSDAGRRQTPGWRGAGPVGLLLFGALLLLRSWGRWCDPLVDTGRELYAPWRLVEGDVLYRDVAWFNGPLSAYFHALAFRLFGVGLQTLVVANVAVMAGTAALLHDLVRRLADRLTAAVGVALFLACFALGQAFPPSDFTWAFPYSHELTHGVALAVAALWALERAARTRRRCWLACHGVLLGLVFLTKPEVFLAAALASAAGLFFYRTGVASLSPIVVGAAAPPLVAFVMLATAMPPAEACRGVLGGWTGAFLPELRTNHFYRYTRGTLDIEHSLAMAALWSGAEIALFGALALLARAWGKARDGSLVARVVAFAVPAAVLYAVPDIAWHHATRALPFLLPVVLVVWVWRCWRVPGDLTAAGRATLAVLGLTMLAKVMWSARIAHYGFALVLPGTLALVVALLADAPAALERRGGAPQVFRSAVVGVLVAMVAHFVGVSGKYFASHTTPVAEGGDAFLADARGRLVETALEILRDAGADGRTLLVLPEGVTINYLGRMRTPTSFINFLPPELIIFGEDRILQSLRAQPPDFLVLLPRSMREYGEEHWGDRYGASLARWAAEPRRFELLKEVRTPAGRLLMQVLRRR